MKKSFLNRAMAAAIAVPVALSQTVLFASFAEDTVPNSKAITVDTFLNVPVKDSSAHPILPVSDSTAFFDKDGNLQEEPYQYYIESNWYDQVRLALNSVDGEAAKNFDIDSIVDQLGRYSDKWYADLAKAATTATAQVVGTDVIINFNVNMTEDAQAIIKEKVVNTIVGGNSSLDKEVVSQYITTEVPAASYGTVTLTVHTNEMEATQGVTFDVKAVTDAGEITTLEEAEAYADGKIAAYQKELKADAEKIVSYYRGLSQEQLDDAIYLRDTAVDEMVNNYTDLKNKAFNKAETALNKEISRDYTKNNYNEVLADVKAEADSKTSDTSKAGKVVNRIPDTISEAVSNNTVLKIYTEALRQLNSFSNGYTVDISLDELGSTLESAHDVVVKGKSTSGEVWGYTTASVEDTQVNEKALVIDGSAEENYYYNYFNELLEKNGVTDKEVATITSEKKVEAEGNASYSGLNGDGTLHVERVLTITLKDIEPTESEPTESESETETETESETQPDSGETETETEIVKPIGEYTATWEIGKRSAYAGDTGVRVPISVEGDAPSLTLSTFKFDVDIQDGPAYTGYEWGSAYDLMGKEFNPADYTGAGSAGELGSVQADNASSVIFLTFDIPADLTPGRYAITFNGDVQAVRIDNAEVDVTEVNGYIDVLPPDVTIQTVEYRYNVVGKSKFYFAHDTRAFDMNDLLSMSTLRRKEVYSDGTESDWTIANEFDGVTFALEDESLTSPKAVYDREILKVDENGIATVEFSESDHNAYFKQTLKFKIVDTNVGDDVKIIFVDENDNETDAVTGNVYIGVKGDASLNGTVNANDAAIVLKYAAAFGAGLDPVLFSEDDAELEAFAYFLAEVTGESEDHGVHDSNGNVQTIADLNAGDSAFILKYAAQAGAGLDPDWYEILPEPLPKYTKAIGRANGGVNDKN